MAAPTAIVQLCWLACLGEPGTIDRTWYIPRELPTLEYVAPVVPVFRHSNEVEKIDRVRPARRIIIGPYVPPLPLPAYMRGPWQ